MFQAYGNIIKRMSGGGQTGDTLVPPEEDKEQEKGSKRHGTDSTEYLVHHWLEAVFAYFQVVVLWHEPQISVRATSALLSLFLLLTHFAPRFYAILLMAIFLYNLNKFWFRHVWPRIRVPPGRDREEEMRLDVDRFTYLHPQLMTLNELEYHIRNLTRLGGSQLQQLFQLRRQKPTQFCLRICFILSCTAYLGRIISGLTLVFSALVIIMSGPGIYAHLLPEQYKQWLKQRYQSLVLSEELVNEEAKRQVQDENQDFKTSDKSTTMAHISKEVIATSVATTMKSIESLFGNLRKKSTDSTTSTSATDTTNILDDSPNESEIQPPSLSSATVLSNLREDSAKVLYNLIDVTLMGSGAKDRQTKKGASIGSHQSDRPEATQSSEQSTATESITLVENEEEDQQDDGFVML